MVCAALQWTEERDEEFVSEVVVVVEMEVVKEVEVVGDMEVVEEVEVFRKMEVVEEVVEVVGAVSEGKER